MDVVALIIGSIAGVVSLTLAGIEIYRYCKSLRLRINGTQWYSSGEDWATILVQVTLVNPSSVGLTVYELKVVSPSGYQVSLLRGQYDFSEGLVIYIPPRQPTTVAPVSLRAGDILPLPLDISPRQSATGWIVLGVYPKPALTLDSDTMKCILVADDVNGKELARTEAILLERQ